MSAPKQPSQDQPVARFKTPPTRISLGSTDDQSLVVHAQYNPGQLEMSKDIPWTPTSQANNANQNGLHLEFTGAKGRTTQIELLFDGYEAEGKVSGTNGADESVSALVAKLEKMASIWKPDSIIEGERRPHLCVAVWGPMLANFRCVITKISTKYTMFSPSGEPLRATCTISLMEADVVSIAKQLEENKQQKKEKK